MPIPQARFGLFQQNFDGLIAANGVRLLWRKSHVCSCVMSGGGLSGPGVPGSGKPSCQSCYGLGIYWDVAVGPFLGVVSFMSMTRSPDEPGVGLDEKFGPVLSGSPNITISQAISPLVWAEASTDDQFIEVDAPARFNAILAEGQNNFVPFFEALSIAPTGAVTTWDSINNINVPVIGYTVSGNRVASGLAYGTPFTVEFMATNIYMTFRRPGGQAHIRPFGQAQAQQLPRRFQAQQVDTWIRARIAQNDDTQGAAAAAVGATFPVVTTAGRV